MPTYTVGIFYGATKKFAHVSRGFNRSYLEMVSTIGVDPLLIPKPTHCSQRKSGAINKIQPAKRSDSIRARLATAIH